MFGAISLPGKNKFKIIRKSCEKKIKNSKISPQKKFRKKEFWGAADNYTTVFTFVGM